MEGSPSDMSCGCPSVVAFPDREDNLTWWCNAGRVKVPSPPQCINYRRNICGRVELRNGSIECR